MHSATKYIGGHSDVLGGGAGGPRPRAFRPAVFHAECDRRRDGALEAFLCSRGLKTLELRSSRTIANGPADRRVSGRHHRVRPCTIPGWRRTPATNSPGGRWTAALARCSASRWPAISRRPAAGRADQAVSPGRQPGRVESLIEQPASMSHASYDARTAWLRHQRRLDPPQRRARGLRRPARRSGPGHRASICRLATATAARFSSR